MPYRNETETLLLRIAELERDAKALERRLERFGRAFRHALRRRMRRVSLFVVTGAVIAAFGSKLLVVDPPVAVGPDERAMSEALGLRDAVVQELEASGECLYGGRALIDHGRLSYDSYRGDMDPWNTHYRISCHVVAVQSAGPDGKYGTADDVIAISKEQRIRARP